MKAAHLQRCFRVYVLLFFLALLCSAVSEGNAAAVETKEPTLFLEVSVSPDDFSTTPPYYAVATITARIRNADGSISPVTTMVNWSVLDSLVNLPLDKDPDHPVWRRAPNALNGLAWGRELPPELLRRSEANRSGREFDPDANRPTGDTAFLMDIVGSRTVTVQAQTRVLGTPMSATTRITFGNGPLSVFTKGPSPTPLKWAKTNPLSEAVSFPAASYCNGNIPVEHFTGRPNDSWTDTMRRSPDGGIYLYAEGSSLPTVTQLQAVSSAGEGGFSGAGLAAGWPDDDYWTGEAFENDITAYEVMLYLGFALWQFLPQYNYAVCISAPHGAMKDAFRWKRFCVGKGGTFFDRSPKEEACRTP